MRRDRRTAFRFLSPHRKLTPLSALRGNWRTNILHILRFLRGSCRARGANKRLHLIRIMRMFLNEQFRLIGWPQIITGPNSLSKALLRSVVTRTREQNSRGHVM